MKGGDAIYRKGWRESDREKKPYQKIIIERCKNSNHAHNRNKCWEADR